MGKMPKTSALGWLAAAALLIAMTGSAQAATCYDSVLVTDLADCADAAAGLGLDLSSDHPLVLVPTELEMSYVPGCSYDSGIGTVFFNEVATMGSDPGFSSICRELTGVV